MVFVSLDFVPPSELRAHDFVLRPLGPEHNESDYLAWASSIQHIRSTPDFRDTAWPNDHISLAQNLSDLVRHADDFAKRAGFTYTVLDATESKVIGCVYIYPSTDPAYEAKVRSWLSVQYSARDQELRRAVAAWLEHDWPFSSIDYSFQPGAG